MFPIAKWEISHYCCGMEQKLIGHLLALAEAYRAVARMEESTLGRLSAADGRFFARLRDGKTVTVRKYDDVVTWFSANWPADLDWPKGIERPPFRADALIPVAAPSVGAPLPDALIEALNHQAPRGAK